MDVIINNPAPQAQYAPTIQTPSAYGPGYGRGDHHGGPGFLFPSLLIAGVVFWMVRGKRRRWDRGPRTPRLNPAGGSAPAARHDDDSNVYDDPREATRDLFRRGRDKFFSDGALGIARERYARGEINADEYENMRQTLSGEAERDDRRRSGPDLGKPDTGNDELKL